ncbi:hypothetical protein OSTOST_16807 [Ostertagia ostertagi]
MTVKRYQVSDFRGCQAALRSSPTRFCCSMSSNPSWWPYRIPVDEALKKSTVLVIGVVVGANVVSYYWKPMRARGFLSSTCEIRFPSLLLKRYVSSVDPWSTTRHLIEESLNYCVNIRRCMMSGSQNLRNNSDVSGGDRRDSKESQGSDHYGSDGDLRSTLFKKVFKMYKRRVPPPDLSGVLGQL